MKIICVFLVIGTIFAELVSSELNLTSIEIHSGCSEVITFNVNKSIIEIPKVICVTKEPATYENAVENCQSLGGNLLHFDHVDLQTTFFTKYEVNHTTNTNTSLWVKNWTEGDAALQWTTKGQPNKTQCMAFEHTDKMGFAAESCETKFKSLCDLSLPSLPTKNITLPSLNIPSSIGGFFTTLSTLLSNNSEIVIETKITNEGEPVSMWCKLLFRLFC